MKRCTLLAALLLAPAVHAADRPNVLWITCEDMGPHLGCYGDKYATTPNLDRFAQTALRYRIVWSNAPVCAPARTTLISGLYPTSTGSEHMRSMARLPAGFRMYPQYLRDAGYYCTNNSKEDYNLEKPGQVWDESSARAHWKNRKPGQPFFAIFNLTITHESQIRRRPHTLVHDPAKVPLPAYHPDAPEVRHDWAQYYDNIATMDGQFAARLKELHDAGLADDTIVFFYSDHGSGMPSNKRWPYDRGLHVPLLIHVPKKYHALVESQYAAGGTMDRPVAFIDFAPTLLSLAGIKPPAHFQGRAFLGSHAGPPQRYLHGFRGRMDERYDMVRSVRDERYVYVRHYLPHKVYGQYLDYMFQTPTTRVWKRLFDEGKLTPEQAAFWKTKPPEELYDLQTDPHEVHNLAASPQHQDVLKRLRQVVHDHALKVRDVGFLPEDEIHTRSAGSTPYELGRDESKYPLERILATAELASSLRLDVLPQLKQALEDKDSAVRYWAALGFLMRGKDAVAAGREELHKALADESPNVRIAAAEALGQYGDTADLDKALKVLLELVPLRKNRHYVSVAALNALAHLGPKAVPGLAVIKDAAKDRPPVPQREQEYVPRLVERITADARK